MKKSILSSASLIFLGLILCSIPLQTLAVQQTEIRRYEIAENDIAARISAIVSSAKNPLLTETDFSKHKETVAAIYRYVENNLLWFDRSRVTDQAIAATRLIEEAPDYGLRSSDYDVGVLETMRKNLESEGQTDAKKKALFDTALSVSLVRFLTDLHYGRVDPKRMNFTFEVREKHQKPDLAQLVFQSAFQGGLKQHATALEPNLTIYRNLKKALATYRKLAQKAYPPFIIARSLHPGESHPQLTELKGFLTATGDYVPSAEFSGEIGKDAYVYSDSLAEAVKRFQKRHGLETDGIIGNKTAAALNTPFSKRVQQIEMALERLRWLPSLDGDRFIAVNIPAFRLWAFDSLRPEGKYSLNMKVVVGQALDKQTPIFMADMKYLDFRPFWNIPYSIAVKEILPEMRNDPRNYLATHDMEFVRRFGNDASPVNYSAGALELLRRGELKLRQRPGKKNALGRVKFIFPNYNAVYLHDTPAQSLFSRSRRDFSHGCIRVEDPEKLAAFALEFQPEWDMDKIRQAMNSGRTRQVHLLKPIPVIIFYTTAIADPDGTISFFEDYYGHDEALLTALSQ
ncbi:MAG: L,D-transpeptidase family protein [Gammaproteobacteria bacterium]